MLHTISGTHKDTIGQYIAGYWSKNLDQPVTGPYSALGWMRDGKLVGQALFVDWTGSNIEIHIYGDHCMNRKTIRQIYRYVFVYLNCNRLTARPKVTNKKLLQLLPRLGFEYEYTQEAYHGTPQDPVDAHVYKLTKKNALKWL